MHFIKAANFQVDFSKQGRQNSYEFFIFLRACTDHNISLEKSYDTKKSFHTMERNPNRPFGRL